MIPSLAASAGDRGFAGHSSLRDAVSSGMATLVEHDGLSVLWSSQCPWIDHHDDGDVLVVVDGRLHQPRCDADAAGQLVASRYRHAGGEFARNLLGDFVVVVLDRTRRSLLIARDPLGARPWYQADAGSRYAGATSEGDVASLPWVDDRIDERTAIEHLAAVWEGHDRTYHLGIGTLAAGHTATVADGRTRSHRHHQWRLEPDLATSWDEAAERCRTVLDEVVEDRLHATDAATGELSGGLDSSTVVGTIARLGHDDLLVGRLEFDGRADERRFSDAVAEHWGVPMVTAKPVVPGPDEAAALTRSLRRPVPDPHFMMFAGLHRELLALGRIESLTGFGGDDAFVTSTSGTLLVSALRLRRWPEVRELLRANSTSPQTLWTDLVRPALHHVARWKGRAVPRWVSAEAALVADLPTTLRARPNEVTGIDAIDERIGNITSGYDAKILETRAVVADLEGRRDSHPFLDPRFIEATYGLNPWWPGRDGHTRALQPAAYGDRLPPAVAARRGKAEFSEVFWPALLDHETLERVRTGPLVDLGWLELRGFDALVHDAKAGMANAAIPVSRCVSLDRWIRSTG